MVYGRLLTFFYAMLLVFSQQQVLLHPYQHKADWQLEFPQQTLAQNQNTEVSGYESNINGLIPQDSYDNKQAPGHGVNCTQCIALSGISSVVGSHSFVFHVLSNQFQHSISAVQTFASAVDVPYQSRAPPAFA